MEFFSSLDSIFANGDEPAYEPAAACIPPTSRSLTISSSYDASSLLTSTPHEDNSFFLSCEELYQHGKHGDAIYEPFFSLDEIEIPPEFIYSPVSSEPCTWSSSSTSDTTERHEDLLLQNRTRKGKTCITVGCSRRAQSMGHCKTHGGGARCKYIACTKSSQGGGFCRFHGGGKKCTIPNCNRGTQRAGLCYVSSLI